MIQLRQEKGASITLGQMIAQGGEGAIYTIRENPDILAKIFHEPTAAKNEKLRVMLLNVPDDPTRVQGHISIAWPISRISDAHGRYIGFLLPYIHYGNNPDVKVFPLLKIYNPHDRKQTGRYFTWEYLLRMTQNLAAVIEALHKKNYVIGDLNESNVFVTNSALVTLIDCDSLQIPVSPQNSRWFPRRQRYFPCLVGKAEYTPPELYGKDFSRLRRKAYHDDFSLAVLIFLMLMEGRHPFAGFWQGDRKQLTLEESIQHGYFPYTYPHSLKPPKNALPFNTLPPKVQKLMHRCFVTCSWSIGPLYPLAWYRPSARAWRHALKDAEKHLVDCEKNNQHVYSDHLAECPWCKRMNLGIPDPFPPIQGKIKKRLRSQSKRRYSRRIVRFLAFSTTIILYVLEIVFWHFYQPWLSRYTPPIQCILFFLLLIIPVLISMIIYIKFRAEP